MLLGKRRLKAADHGFQAPNLSPPPVAAGRLTLPQGEHTNETSAGRAGSRPDRSKVVRQIHFTLTTRELVSADIPTYQPLFRPQEVRPILYEEARRGLEYVFPYSMPTIKPKWHAGRSVPRSLVSVHNRCSTKAQAGSERDNRCLHANPDLHYEQFAPP